LGNYDLLMLGGAEKRLAVYSELDTPNGVIVRK
jgi:hypothetical protein